MFPIGRDVVRLFGSAVPERPLLESTATRGSSSEGASRGCFLVLAQPFVSCPRMTPAGWAVLWKLT